MEGKVARFINTVKVEWPESEPRNMRLLEDIGFIDSKGELWLAQAGSIINGASIPPIFWPIIGSPYVGKYRRSTVLHDVHCAERTEPHEAVHKMFLEAMLADGVEKDLARTMFRAVWNFGPKWDENGNDLAAYGGEDPENEYL